MTDKATDKARALLSQVLAAGRAVTFGVPEGLHVIGDELARDIRAYLAEPVTAPAGLADALAAVLEEGLPDFGDNPAQSDELRQYDRGWNNARDGAIRCARNYLRSIEAAPLTCTLEWCFKVAVCGDFINARGRGAGYARIHGEPTWRELCTCNNGDDLDHSDKDIAGLIARALAAGDPCTFIHNGAVYSIREGKAGAEPLAVDSDYGDGLEYIQRQIEAEYHPLPDAVEPKPLAVGDRFRMTNFGGYVCNFVGRVTAIDPPEYSGQKYKAVYLWGVAPDPEGFDPERPFYFKGEFSTYVKLPAAEQPADAPSVADMTPEQVAAVRETCAELMRQRMQPRPGGATMPLHTIQPCPCSSVAELAEQVRTLSNVAHNSAERGRRLERLLYAGIDEDGDMRAMRIDDIEEQLRTLQQRVTDLDRRARLSDEHITDIGRIACAASGEAAQAGQDVSALQQDVAALKQQGGVAQHIHPATWQCQRCGMNKSDLCHGACADCWAAEAMQGGELREGEPCLAWAVWLMHQRWVSANYHAAQDIRNGGNLHFKPQPAAPGVQ